MGIAVKSDKIITINDKVVIIRTTNVDYGCLYNSYAVANIKGLAPEGWHIPSYSEAETFQSYLTQASGGGKIKKTGLTHWDSPNEGATNETSFSMVGSGYRDNNGNFGLIKQYGLLWTDDSYHNIVTYYNNATLDVSNHYPKTGFAVRCIRDNAIGWSHGNKAIDIDGNVYDTVKIGDQIWTVQNLAVTHYNDGTAIPNETVKATWAALDTGAYCAYNNDNSYVFL